MRQMSLKVWQNDWKTILEIYSSTTYSRRKQGGTIPPPFGYRSFPLTTLKGPAEIGNIIRYDKIVAIDGVSTYPIAVDNFVGSRGHL